jgi:hypothetical protein
MDGIKLAKMVRTLYPFAGITYTSDGTVRVLRFNCSPSGDVYKAEGEGNKGCVGEFSLQSRKRLLERAKRFDGEFLTFATLTYPDRYETNGRKVKKDLNKVLGILRYEYGAGVNYIWWLEFQERGAPHLHIAWDREYNSGLADRVWASWTKRFVQRFGLDNKKKADYLYSLGSVIEPMKKNGGVGRYLAKYILKDRQKIVPYGFRDVGRFWGTNRGLTLKQEKTLLMSQWEFVSLVETCGKQGVDWSWLRKIDILPANVYDTGVDFSNLKRGIRADGTGYLYCDVGLGGDYDSIKHVRNNT